MTIKKLRCSSITAWQGSNQVVLGAQVMHIDNGPVSKRGGPWYRNLAPSQLFVPVLELREAFREDRTDIERLLTPGGPLVTVDSRGLSRSRFTTIRGRAAMRDAV